ncbi:uncharacterized protein LOC124554196 [Schistocerca americana]|uniref:uncharacterized protein LOC124554196 n=1 Tax=Schistocerca americana TaxID=7009 RepID=UPI001F4F5753|nr:uncharacterized protein LOC124554196 [Schistocerca americana]
MRKQWSREEIMELIQLYEANECLWNTKCSGYRDRTKKHKVLEEIGLKFSCSQEEVQRKLHNLRNQVSQELKKIKQRRSRSGAGDNCKSKWPYFDALKFVIPGLAACVSKQSNLAETSSQPVILWKVESTGTSEQTTEDVTERQGIVEDPTREKSSRKRKHEESDDLVARAALKVLAKGVPDEYEIFGEYVASELRSLRSDSVRRKLKNEIRKAIIRAADADEESYTSASTS